MPIFNLIIAFFITIGIVFNFRKSIRGFVDFIVTFIVFYIPAIAAILFISLVISSLCEDKNLYEYKTTKNQIELLNNTDKGASYIGTGFKENEVYHHYVLNKNEKYIIESVPAEYSIIEYTVNDSAYVVKHIPVKYKNKLLNLVLFKPLLTSLTSYEFHVPKGSIICRYGDE